MSHRPTRTIAILLAALVGCGVGHCYAGLQRRAAAWLGGMAVLIFACAALILPLARAIGLVPALGLWLVVVAASWFGPLIDLVLIGQARFTATPVWKVLAFAGAFLAVAIATPVLIRALVLEAYRIPAGSMLPTLAVGDRMFVDKARYRFTAPKHGDVAVFQYPEAPQQDFVKRVMAVPGDVLTVRDGHPRINGWEIPHCIVGRLTVPGANGDSFSGILEVEHLYGQHYYVLFDEKVTDGTVQGPYVAAPGEYWVLGDNRSNSHDSRFWAGGKGRGVPRSMFRGLAAQVWMPTPRPVDRPVLPDSSPELQEALERCLKAKPIPDLTIPPKPH